MGSRVCIARYTYLSDANVAKALLMSNGIDCSIDSEHVTSIMPHASIALGGIRLFVDAEDAEVANEMIGITHTLETDDSND